MGSIPITRSTRNAEERVFEFEEAAHVAQSVEHVLGKNGVIGSSPIVGSECRYWIAAAFFATVSKKGRRINALKWTRRCAQQEESIHGQGSI